MNNIKKEIKAIVTKNISTKNIKANWTEQQRQNLGALWDAVNEIRKNRNDYRSVHNFLSDEFSNILTGMDDMVHLVNATDLPPSYKNMLIPVVDEYYDNINKFQEGLVSVWDFATKIEQMLKPVLGEIKTED